MTHLETVSGFFLFLKEDIIKKQLEETGRLYVRIKRGWDRSSVVFFIKSKDGVFVTGFGYVDFVFDDDELTGLDNFYCRVYGFKQCLGLKNKHWFSSPVNIDDFVSVIGGNFGSLHGSMIGGNKLDELLDFLEA